ncbi:MAG TPA: glutathione S-transferase family protein [Caulobacteraceae bacterium]|nr:glutathione S-transferase family protein [Caulobacteraceae bacterium]
MTLTLHFHPLSSYCWKVLIGLYENGVGFERVVVDLGEEASRAALLQLWPVGKMPVLVDAEQGEVVPESSVILEYIDRRYPGCGRLVPADPDEAWRVRLWDRFFDLHVHEPMQKIVGDRLRPADRKDPQGVEEARARLETSYRLIERELHRPSWFGAGGFSLIDCAAAPSLYYADRVQPLGPERKALASYRAWLMARPSVARVLDEALPYAHLFPED